jgi:transcriptional regulator with XRE-family HTH domain
MSTPKFVISSAKIHLVSTELKRIREAEGVKQNYVAKKLKIKQGNVSTLENKRTGPSLLSLTKFLESLGYQLIIEKKIK